MDAKEEREKVIEAARKYSNTKCYTIHLKNANLVEFALEQTETLRQQLREANAVITSGDIDGSLATAYLEKWRVE